jgi:hypothetical protein
MTFADRSRRFSHEMRFNPRNGGWRYNAALGDSRHIGNGRVVRGVP